MTLGILVTLSIVLASLNFERNDVELGLERMHATTLVDAHLVEADTRCDSSIGGPVCSRGPISFLDGMFPVKLAEYQAYYFFQHSADTRFKSATPLKVENLVLPGRTFTLFSCNHFSPTPKIPSWAAIEGDVVCFSGGVEFHSQVTKIRFATPVVVDFVQGYRLVTDFPVVIIGNNNDAGGAQWDILVDEYIPSVLRKEPIQELIILGPSLYLTDLRVIYYPHDFALEAIAWHLVLDPKHFMRDPPVRVSSYVDVGFDFGMVVPTIAPMVSVLEMQRAGLRLRRDAIGEEWVVPVEEHMEPTKLHHVRELIEYCLTINCRAYHAGMDPDSVIREMSVFRTKLASVELYDIVNAPSFEDLFRMVWKQPSFNHLKLMVLRLRWDKFLMKQGMDRLIGIAPNIAAGIVDTAKACMQAISLFAKHVHKIAHKAGLLNEIGSLRVHFFPRFRDVHVTFFAMSSGRETTAIFKPTCPVTDFLAQVLGLPHDPDNKPAGTTIQVQSQLPKFKVFLQHLMEDVLDMEDHLALKEHRKQESMSIMEV